MNITLGVQEPPANSMIYNRRQADGSCRPIADFFNSSMLWGQLEENRAFIKRHAIADYRTGWRINAADGMPCDCANDDQRAGWWARRQNIGGLVGSQAVEAVAEVCKFAAIVLEAFAEVRE